MTTAPLRSLVHARRDELLALLEELVAIETPTGSRPGAARLVAHLGGVLERDGWTVGVERREDVGDVVVARWGAPPGRSTLLLAHYDTVHPVGTIEAVPWSVEGDVACGPGTLDMKAGIANAVLALRVLRASGTSPCGPLTLLVTSDEETGSHASRALIEAEAVRHDRVLVLEPSVDDGSLKVARKGVADFHLTFEGSAAHAGLAPETGASALVELAHAALSLERLADPSLGTTVSPTVARAGHATNVIADRGRLSVDVRLPTTAEAGRVERAIRGYEPRDARVRVAVEGGVNRPPMEATPGNLALLAEAAAIAAPWGWEVQGATVGGGSDGNFTSALAVPTLDGVGAVGGGAHTSSEHVRIGATLDRVALVAALLASPGPVLA